METTPQPRCPLCLEPRSFLVFEKEGFSHLGCPGCGSLYLFPPPTPEDLDALYQSESSRPQCQGCWETEPVHMRALWRRCLNGVDQLVGKGPLLDVGCGSGQFLSFAESLGWKELFGLELSPLAASRAREISDATIDEEGFLQKEFGSMQFHAITLWSVFEHFPSPDHVLQKCHRLLKPGGVLVIDTPHGQGLSLRLFKEKTVVVTPPEHIVYPSLSGMKTILERTQFTPQALETSIIYLGQIASAAEAVPSSRRTAPGTTYSRWYTHLTQSRLFLFAMHAANHLLRLLRLGDQLTVIAVKR